MQFKYLIKAREAMRSLGKMKFTGEKNLLQLDCAKILVALDRALEPIDRIIRDEQEKLQAAFIDIEARFGKPKEGEKENPQATSEKMAFANEANLRMSHHEDEEAGIVSVKPIWMEKLAPKKEGEEWPLDSQQIGDLLRVGLLVESVAEPSEGAVQ